MAIKLNHINLPVSDVAAASVFFQTYFDFTSADVKANDTLSILIGSDGFTLVLMNSRMNENGNHVYPDAFHIGFFVDTKAKVDDLFERLKANSVSVDQAPQRIRKTYGFYFRYQELLIEIATEEI